MLPKDDFPSSGGGMKTVMMVLVFLVFVSSDGLSQEQEPQATSAKVLFGLPYAEPKNAHQRLDVYAPEGAKNLPIVVWVHGGSWTRGDKALSQHKPYAFTRQGFVFVSVNYRFVPSVTPADQAGDVAKAIKYVHDHCEKWGGDPERIFSMGHSAGAHLSALVCTDQKYLKAAGLELPSIIGCIAVDVAAYDISARYEKASVSLQKILADIFGKDSTSQKRVSPINHVSPDKGIPPFLVIHIGIDPQKSQSQSFVKALLAAKVPTRVHVAQGKGHKKLDEEIGLPGDEPTKAVFEFLDSVLEN